MGYDLSNSCGDYHQWKVLGWWHLLNLAKRYGWEPAGTLARKGETREWNRGYFMNAGQTVSLEDAQSLSNALAQLLADPKRQEIAGEVAARLQEIVDDASITEQSNVSDVIVEPIGFIRSMFARFGDNSVGVWSFNDKDDSYLNAFIAFCRKGEFRIE